MKLYHFPTSWVFFFFFFFFKKTLLFGPSQSILYKWALQYCSRASLNFVLKAENAGLAFLALWPLPPFTVLSLSPGGSWSSLLTESWDSVCPQQYGGLWYLPLPPPTQPLPGERE